MVIGGPSKVVPRFANSMIIAFGSTFLAVCFARFRSLRFSRFRVPLADDLLFLLRCSTRNDATERRVPIY